MHRRLIAGLLAVVGASLATVVPAGADADGFGYTDGERVGAGVSDSPSSPSGRGGTPARRCEYEALSADNQGPVGATNWNGRWGNGNGIWMRKTCYDDTGIVSATLVWVPQRVDPQQLAKQARDEVPTPSPTIRMNPPAEKGEVTNVETWLWIEPSQWQPVTASAAAGNVTVTTTATPDHVVWDMGNGDTVTCNGPGKPYDTSRPAADQSTDCGYTYRRSSARESDGRYHVTATVHYQVAWTATGIAAGGALAPITQRSTVAIRVAEIQALNQ